MSEPFGVNSCPLCSSIDELHVIETGEVHCDFCGGYFGNYFISDGVIYIVGDGVKREPSLNKLVDTNPES
jgi:hypothetical protein